MGGFIKGDRMKYISSKLFYTRDFQKNDDITCKKFIHKSLQTTTFEKMMHKIEMQRFKIFEVMFSSRRVNMRSTFFFF